MKNRKKFICVFLGLILLIGTASMCALIQPARDDFFYSTFCDDGFTAYIENIITHYREVTGRVFVHMILCPLLQLDMWPFRIFNLLLICVLGYLCVRLCTEDRGNIAVGFTAFLCLFWLIGTNTLADSVLWGAGAFNYLFPTELVVLYAYLLQKNLIHKSGGTWLIPMAFLSAATVEMTGILTIVVILYFCFAYRDYIYGRGVFLTLNLGAALSGYLFLFTSSGVTARLEKTGFDSISLIERININFAQFDRMICCPGGIWVIVLLTLFGAACILFLKGKKVFSGITVLSAAAVALTGVGIIYDGIILAAISIGVFLVLCFYGIWSFKIGNRVVPLSILCITVSLGICVVSPVVGARMVFPSAVFLIIICMCSVLQLPQKVFEAFICGLSIPVGIILTVYIVMFSENAQVINQNKYNTEQWSPEEPLVCTYVPHDTLVEGTVPTTANFGVYYLQHMGIPYLEISRNDPTFTPIYYNGQKTHYLSIMREEQFYVPVRIASEILHSTVSWEFSSAIIETGQGRYCFHLGDYVANVDHGICHSVKLMDRIRSIDSTIYISQRDFEELFSVKLSITD